MIVYHQGESDIISFEKYSYWDCTYLDGKVDWMYLITSRPFQPTLPPEPSAPPPHTPLLTTTAGAAIDIKDRMRSHVFPDERRDGGRWWMKDTTTASYPETEMIIDVAVAVGAAIALAAGGKTAAAAAASTATVQATESA